MSVYCVVATRGRRSPKKRLSAKVSLRLSARQTPNAPGTPKKKNADRIRTREQRQARPRLPSQALHQSLHLALRHNSHYAAHARSREIQEGARIGGRPFLLMGRCETCAEVGPACESDKIGGANTFRCRFTLQTNSAPSLAGLFVAEVTLALQRIVAASDTQLLVRGGRS